MSKVTVRGLEYFHVSVRHGAGEGYQLLAHLASEEINLLAFDAVPIGPETTQLTLFPDSSHRLTGVAKKIGLSLTGPHQAILVQGDDRLGAIADIHQSLYEAQINVYASQGVTDGKGDFGYILYVRSEDYERALRALEV